MSETKERDGVSTQDQDLYEQFDFCFRGAHEMQESQKTQCQAVQSAILRTLNGWLTRAAIIALADAPHQRPANRSSLLKYEWALDQITTLPPTERKQVLKTASRYAIPLFKSLVVNPENLTLRDMDVVRNLLLKMVHFNLFSPSHSDPIYEVFETLIRKENFSLLQILFDTRVFPNPFGLDTFIRENRLFLEGVQEFIQKTLSTSPQEKNLAYSVYPFLRAASAYLSRERVSKASRRWP